MALPALRTFATDIAETSSTLGVGTYSLNGARTGYRSFADGFDTSDTPYYVVRNAADTKYEHNRGGIYTDSGPDTLTRNVLYSSNGNAAVSWISGDLPLNVYVPNAAEVFEFMVRGWVMDTRDAWLKFGHWFDSSVPDVATWKIYDGASDIKVGDIDLVNHKLSLDFKVMPPGMMFHYASATIPAGVLECLGQSLLRTAYPALFAIIGTTYGSADGTHFTLPKMNSRTAYGRDPASSGIFDYAGRNTIGTTVGAQYHSHGVSVSVSVSGGVSVSVAVSGSLAGGITSGNASAGGSAGGSTYAILNDTVQVSGTLAGGGSGSFAGGGSGSGSTDSRDNVSPGIILPWLITTGGV